MSGFGNAISVVSVKITDSLGKDYPGISYSKWASYMHVSENLICKKGSSLVAQIMCSTTLYDFFRGSLSLLLSRKKRKKFTLLFSTEDIICDIFLHSGNIQVVF